MSRGNIGSKLYLTPIVVPTLCIAVPVEVMIKL